MKNMSLQTLTDKCFSTGPNTDRGRSLSRPDARLSVELGPFAL